MTACRKTVQTLGRTVAQLAATVDELLTISVERGALDDAGTRSRLAAVMRPKVVAAPPNAAVNATAKPPAMVRCVKCRTSIALAYSNMTEHGATCDRCV